jgi:Protein of unknown function (DUF2750)
MATRPKEVEAILKLDGPARFKHFVKLAVDRGKVWGLWASGWASGTDDAAASVLPLWPAREYAELCRVDEWADYEPREITLEALLDDVLPGLRGRQMRAGIFPTPKGKWVLPTLEELDAALRAEMERYA